MSYNVLSFRLIDTVPGLSWLIGSSLAEVLTSIIFLFIKHPFDVGDRVAVGKDTFTVKEIRLLSTIFLDSNACLVQAPNTVLNGQVRTLSLLHKQCLLIRPAPACR